MIHESWPWKRELRRDADLVERWCQKGATERRDFLVERKIIVAAYSIRKLVENKKLTDRLEQSQIAVEAAPLTGRVPDHFNWHRVDEFYDLSSARLKSLSMRDLSNAIIHSYILTFDCDQIGRISGIVCASEFQRKSEVYIIKIADVLKVMRDVSEDDVTRVVSRRGGDGQWIMAKS